MFTQSSDLQHMIPGEPPAEALHREDFLNEKNEPTEPSESVPDHRYSHRVAVLRAEAAAATGGFFA